MSGGSGAFKNGPVPAAGNAGPVGPNGNAHVSWKNEHDKDHDRDRDHHHHRHHFAFGFDRWYDNNYDPSCYEYRLVHTKYGKQWMRVYICN